ncbi:MAG TPA: hypothetical protein VK470_15200, partial [Bacteroidota bacterium]|nr:hypothetical protein [Bacteroidota bacterium]
TQKVATGRTQNTSAVCVTQADEEHNTSAAAHSHAADCMCLCHATSLIPSSEGSHCLAAVSSVYDHISADLPVIPNTTPYRPPTAV